MQIYSREIPFFEPVTLLDKLSQSENFVFLDSALNTSGFGRFSFLAYDPFSILSCAGGDTYVDGKKIDKPMLNVIYEQLEKFKLLNNDDIPFTGGLVGFIGYEFSNCLESKINLLKKNRLNFPDLLMGMFDLVIAFDHSLQRSWIYSNGFPETHGDARERRARERCEQLMLLLSQINHNPPRSDTTIAPSSVTSNFDYDSYCHAIKKTIEFIEAGDIYQANISQQFTCELPQSLSTWQLYQRLRSINPAPFAAYLQLNGNIIASASPERFIQVKDRQITTSPIKGTTHRAKDPEEDLKLMHQLRASEKNRAENLMIVDLMRNDLSKVCKTNSVSVPELFGVQSFATVHHLVSTIKGELKTQSTLADVIAATFPGGSITGAPKLRAMEIIDQIEPTARGPYCGSLGYFGFNGNMDTSILIRTFIVKDQMLTFNVGGGIVADSNPHDEYMETLIKANALFYALTHQELSFAECLQP